MPGLELCLKQAARTRSTCQVPLAMRGRGRLRLATGELRRPCGPRCRVLRQAGSQPFPGCGYSAQAARGRVLNLTGAAQRRVLNLTGAAQRRVLDLTGAAQRRSLNQT